MPAYYFVCDACGKTDIELRSMADAKKRKRCSCRKMMRRDFQAEWGGRRNVLCSNWPMECEASGVLPSQIPEAAAKFRAAGVEVEFNPNTGAAIYTSRAHRAKALKAIGMYDRNAGYSDPTKTGTLDRESEVDPTSTMADV